MTAQQLQDFLHRCIPATAALHIRVVSCGADGVALLMPHAPNRNHKNTVFGGSTTATDFALSSPSFSMS